MVTLNIVSQIASRPGERFHAMARKFLAKVKVKDDLLPEYLKDSHMRETNLSHHREQIEQQLEKIRQAVGDAKPATPSS